MSNVLVVQIERDRIHRAPGSICSYASTVATWQPETGHPVEEPTSRPVFLHFVSLRRTVSSAPILIGFSFSRSTGWKCCVFIIISPPVVALFGSFVAGAGLHSIPFPFAVCLAFPFGNKMSGFMLLRLSDFLLLLGTGEKYQLFNFFRDVASPTPGQSRSPSPCKEPSPPIPSSVTSPVGGKFSKKLLILGNEGVICTLLCAGRLKFIDDFE